MMDERDWLAEWFDAHRAHLRAVAYRMLRSASKADDTGQEARVCLSEFACSRESNARSLALTARHTISRS